MKSHLCALAAASMLILAPATAAQFDNQWAAFSKDNAHLDPVPTSISDDTTSLPGDTPGGALVGVETDLAWGDLDKDGWIDVVVVRKQPFTSAGKRTNLLLMNLQGVLTDRTTAFASSSDVVGDQGFLTLTNDRDVVLGDVDGDTWLDVITATTISDSDTKAIGHPRVYMNLGRDGTGAWLGLQHQDARIPQLVSYSTGLPTNPRFCAVAIGDVTGDGFADLYFGDYDSSGAGGVGMPAGADLNDRLLINDGNGFFVDESQSRMTSEMLKSNFGMSMLIADMNQDGVADVVKDQSLLVPQDVRVIYNDPANEGVFNINDIFHVGFEPYHINTGDLNNDGRLDLVISDDGLDRYRYNRGNDELGRVIWSPAKTYEFLTGGDDGFGSNNLIVDIDHDGWADAVHADVDVDIPGGGPRRLHIYHNPGGVPGEEIELLEERESAGAGWIGAVGFTEDSLRKTHDVAVFDLDNDLDHDFVLSRAFGTDVFTQDAGQVCQLSVGLGGPGYSTLSICGEDLTVSGSTADLTLRGAPVSSFTALVVGLNKTAIPAAGGFLVPFPISTVIATSTDSEGEIILPGALVGNGSGMKLYLQAATLAPGISTAWDISNALEIQL